MLKDEQDAYGHELLDYLNGKSVYEIIERDDGYFDVSSGPPLYFSAYDEWPDYEKKAIDYVRGTVLDIGCGAGRHSLYVQEKGLDVTGVDVSPLAVTVCRKRGLKKVFCLSIAEITPDLGTFDTIMMFGNNFGLVESFEKARQFFGIFTEMTSDKGRIVAETRDPHQTDCTEHKEYHSFNEGRGRMPGQARLRVRYKKYVTPWFDYLMVSQKEMMCILDGTGWGITQVIEGDAGIYAVVIDKV